MAVRLQTLGGLRVYRDGEELTSLLRKPVQCALLVYLAVERHATKDALQALLWPDRSPAKARGSLNNTMYELRSALGQWAELHGDEFRVADWVRTDVAELAEASAGHSMPERPSDLLGDFLAATHLASSTEFQRWVDGLRAKCRRLQGGLRKHLVLTTFEQGRLADALDAAREWADGNPVDDEAQYWAIRLEAASGHRADALARYDRFRSALALRHGAEPDEGLQRLVEGIRDGEWTVAPEIEGLGPRGHEREPAAEMLTPQTQWRSRTVVRARLIKLLGGYVAGAWLALQVVGLLLDRYDDLPPAFFDAAIVLALCGLPVIVATAFVQSRPVPRHTLTGLRLLLARWFSWRNATLGGVAALAAWSTALVGWNLAGGPPRQESVAVLAFSTSLDPTDEEEALAVELANDVAREVSRWDAFRVVPQVALAGPMFDLGLASATIRRIEDGLDVARSVDATRLAAVALRLRGDSAYVSTTFVATQGGREIRPTAELVAPLDSTLALAETVAGMLLGFDTLPVLPERVHRGTTVREAFEAHVGGLRRLERWQLEQAEQHFRRAVEVDDEFSLAYLHLAQTLYWRSARTTRDLRAAGPEIGAASARSFELRDRLAEHDRLHVEAFYAFQSGDFPRARALYGRLLQRDPTDLHALILLGTVEYRDPWLEMVGDSVVGPRRDLNRALDLFQEVLRLQPSFDLGYVHLFDILGEVQRSVERRGCRGYYPPAAGTVAIWDPGANDPGGARDYCTIILDSLEFVSNDSLLRMDPGPLEEGADRLLTDAMSQLRRWVAAAPDRPAPRERMVDAWLQQRRRAAGARPSELRALTDSAIAHAEAGLALRPDTTATDLFRLALLHLGSDDFTLADAYAERGLALLEQDSASFPTGLASLYVATGRPTDALAAIQKEERKTYVPDPEHDTFIPFGEGDRIVDRLYVLGATGSDGPEVGAQLDALDRAWASPGYTERQRDLLRRSVAMRILPALILEPSALQAWDEELRLTDPLWRALVTARSAPDSAAHYLALSDRAPSSEPGPWAVAYLQALAEEQIGRPDAALARLSRIHRLPHPIDLTRFHMAWGLATHARFLRGRLHESDGASDAASASYTEFLATRVGSDRLSDPLYREAQARLDGLRTRTGPR